MSANASSASDKREILAALKRAIPLSRMADYGLPARAAKRLHDLEPAPDASWANVAEDIAREYAETGRREAAAGNVALSCLAREHAAAAYNVAQVSFNRDTPEKRRLYALSTGCLLENADVRGCDYHRIEVLARTGEAMFGWDFALDNPAGTIVMFGGLSGWGASFMALARTLKAHGIATILAEAPGQGETRLVSGLHLSRARVDDAARFFTHAAARGGPVGIVGFSYGGLIAAQVAAAVAGAAGLCTNGSPVNIGQLLHPAENEQFGAAFGAEGAELQRRVEEFNFDATRQQIECPVLALEGGADPLVTPGTCLGYVGGKADAIRQIVWEDGLHTLYNHAAERNALIAAWFLDRFRNP